MGCFRGACFICGNMNAEICDGICGTCGTLHEVPKEDQCSTKAESSNKAQQTIDDIDMPTAK